MRFERKMAREAFKKKVKEMKKSGQLRKDVSNAYLWQTYQNMERNYARIQSTVDKFGLSDKAAQLTSAESSDELMATIDDILSTAVTPETESQESNAATESNTED